MHEESLDPHEDINQYVLARIYIFSRLTSATVIIARIKDDTHQKDSNTGKDYSCDGDRIAGSDVKGPIKWQRASRRSGWVRRKLEEEDVLV